jgi:hypothetical protein
MLHEPRDERPDESTPWHARPNTYSDPERVSQVQRDRTWRLGAGGGLSGATEVGQFRVVLGQLPGRGRGPDLRERVGVSPRYDASGVRNELEFVTGVGHLGVASGPAPGASASWPQDSNADPRACNKIAKLLHIIYDCAGEGAGHCG